MRFPSTLDNGRLYARGCSICLDELRQTFVVRRVIKTDTRPIICLDKLSSVVRRSSRTTEGTRDL